MADPEDDQQIQQIVAKFKAIRDNAIYEDPNRVANLREEMQENAADIWVSLRAIQDRVKEIREFLGAATDEEDSDVQDQDLALDDSANIFGMMAAVRHVAAQMAKREAHRKWRSACVQIMSATRRAEELLQPFLLVDVCPEESDVFTHHTVSFHLQAPVEGSVTAVTWSVTEETRTQGAPEAFNFPEVIPGGETEAKMQALEHHLLELQNAHKDSDHSDIAATLHRLGNLSQQAGDLNQAKQYFDETLRMKRSLHGDGDHREIALTLHELGSLSLETGDLKQAKQYLEESLRMNRSLHGDRDHPDIATTLHALGSLSRQAGDLKQAKQYMEESLRMIRSLHGDRDDPDIAAMLHDLGNFSRRAGDIKQAKQYLEKSLRMKRSLHGDRAHSEIAATLHELGKLFVQTGDLKRSKLYSEQYRIMQYAVDRDEGLSVMSAPLLQCLYSVAWRFDMWQLL